MNLSADVWVTVSESRKVWGGLCARLTAKKPNVGPHEVSIKLRLEVPRALFERPALEARIVLPGEPQHVHLDLDVAQEALHAATGLDVRVVTEEAEE